MWTKKEVLFIILTCLIGSGILLAGAVIDTLNGQPIILSITAVVLSAMMISIALYIFDEYIEEIKE